jgi:ferritin-like metal-binding protein YciE
MPHARCVPADFLGRSKRMRLRLSTTHPAHAGRSRQSVRFSPAGNAPRASELVAHPHGARGSWRVVGRDANHEIQRNRNSKDISMAEKNMKDLFLHTLKDVYYAEHAILKTLPEMAKAASSSDLKKAFETHRNQTQEQVGRLNKVFELIGQKAEGEPCEAIQGIIKDGKEVMEEFAGGDALDAGLIAAAQAVEHYEIARYGALRSWAEMIGLDEVETLVETTLDEEKQTDLLLTELAENSANLEAAS